MDFLETLGRELAETCLYAALGLALLSGGYFMLDLFIPGRVGELLVRQRSRNAAVIVCAGLLSIGLIVATALLTTDGVLWHALARAAGYGVLGILLLGATFVVVDLKTPGRLGETISEEHAQPVAYVLAAALVASGAVLAAAIS